MARKAKKKAKGADRRVPKLNVKRGDTVMVIAGDDKGKRGKVLEVYPREQKVLVEGINMVKKHVQPTQFGEEGHVIDKPMPIHVSNVMVVCPVTGKPGKVYRKFVDGRWRRFHKVSGELLDKD